METLKEVVRSLDGAKAEDIVVLDVGEIFPLADHFVICHALNDVHALALADYCEKAMGTTYKHREGQRGSGWILIDGGRLVVHIFQADERASYNLERLFERAKRVDLSSLL